MFKFGVDIVRKSVENKWDELGTFFDDENTKFVSAQERECIIYALQIIRLLEKEGDGFFYATPYDIQKRHNVLLDTLKNMASRYDFLKEIHSLLSLISLDMGFAQKEEFLYKIEHPFSHLEIEKLNDSFFDYIPPCDDWGGSEPYFKKSPIPSRRKNNIWY